MSVLGTLLRTPTPTRSDPTLSLDDYLNWFSFNGHGYQGVQTSMGTNKLEEWVGSIDGNVASGLKANPVVWSVEMVRVLLFAEARLAYRRLRNGRPGDLFSTSELEVFRRPWPGGVTGDLLAMAILDADLAGVHYATTRMVNGRRQIRRLRPDWVTVMGGVPDGVSANPSVNPGWELDVTVVGYLYHPGGMRSGNDPIFLDANKVARFTPMPDPVANWTGMSWLTPLIREVQGDRLASQHKLKFFEHGATPNLLVKLDASVPEDEFTRWTTLFREQHESVANAYRTLFLGGGADATVIGTDLAQVDFTKLQGKAETRIAMAAGVPPVILGASEGLAGSSLNAGNFAAARRRLADGTLRPLWRSLVGSYETLINVPSDAELWFDARDVAFLREDLKEEAEIRQLDAVTMRQLIDAGFEPESVKAALANDDMTLLQHTGLFSVQLQSPGSVSDG